MFLITIITFLFIFVCIILCFLILIQSDKGGGISGAIGGGIAGASSVLGTQDTANILTKATSIFAGTFMALCIIFSLLLPALGTSTTKSALKKRAEQNQYSPASVLQNQMVPIAPSNNGAASTAQPFQPIQPVAPATPAAGEPAK